MSLTNTQQRLAMATKFKPGDLCRIARPTELFVQNSDRVIDILMGDVVVLHCGYENCKDPEILGDRFMRQQYSLILAGTVFGVVKTGDLCKIE